MIHDPILDEVRSIREAIAREHDYNVSAIFAMLRQSAVQSGQAHVNLSTSRGGGGSDVIQPDVAADEATPRR